jgi:hypothetical protein
MQQGHYANLERVKEICTEVKVLQQLVKGEEVAHG